MFPYVKKKKYTPITLKEYSLKKNKVLILRKYGGHGDILMQRMMFEDFHHIMPEIDLTYACPKYFLPLMQNHPYVKAIALEEVKEKDYGIIYDISTACKIHESKMMMKNNLNRSDIWAKHCGINLKNHNGFLNVDEETKEFYKKSLYQINKNKNKMVLLCVQSTDCNFGKAKSLTEQQVYDLVLELRRNNYFVFTIHNRKHVIFDMLEVPQFINIEIDSWMGLVSATDYVISIDTGTFHMSGLLKKPLVGIFSFTDGKLYGKYYNFVLIQKHHENGDWDCGPCYVCFCCPKSKESVKPCMTELTTEMIMNGFQKLLAQEKQPLLQLL